MRKIFAASFSLAAGLLASVAAQAEAPVSQLQTVIGDVTRKFPEVTHVEQSQFDEFQKSGSAVIFDTRSAEEYATSHLEGALRLDPATTADNFTTQYAATLKGKTAVLYCSVGMRSSKLAARIGKAAKKAGASAVVSLKGGIFAWANASRPLVNASGPATAVHGYDATWGKLLETRK